MGDRKCVTNRKMLIFRGRKILLKIMVVFVLSVSIMTGLFLDINAQESLIADYHDKVSYTQQELAGMLQKSLAESIEFDYDKVNHLVSTMISEEGIFEEWLTETLDGLVPLGEVIEEDGYFGFLAMDIEAKELSFIVFNVSEDCYALELTISDKAKTPAKSEVYAFERDKVFIRENEDFEDEDLAENEITEDKDNDSEQEETDDLEEFDEDSTAIDNHDNEDNENLSQEDENIEDIDTSEEDDEEEHDDINEGLGAEVEDATIDKDEEIASEILMRAVSRRFLALVEEDEVEIEVDVIDIEEFFEEEAMEDEAVTEESIDIEVELGEDLEADIIFDEYTIELQRQFSNSEADGSYQMILLPGEFGQITLYTGLLNGGTIDNAGLFTGDTNRNNRNVLRIYSQADSQSVGADADTDFVIYNQNDLIYYEINEASAINVTGTGTTASESTFYIELHNTKPVTIRQYHLTTGLIDANTTTHISTETDGAILNIMNEYDVGICFAGTLNASGTATINVDSTYDYAIRSFFDHTAAINLSGGFTLTASGMNGIDTGSAVDLIGGSRLLIHDIETNDQEQALNVSEVNVVDSELYFENIIANGSDPMVMGAVTLTNSVFSIETVTATQSGNVLAIGELRVQKGSTMTLSDINSKRSGHGLYVNGAIIFDDSLLKIDKVNVNGNLVSGTKTFAATNTEMEIVNVETTGSGIYAAQNITLDTLSIIVRDSLIEEYAFHFIRGIDADAMANRLQNCKFDIVMGDSKGGALFFGAAFSANLVLDNNHIKLSGNANEKPLLTVENDLYLGRDGNSYLETGTLIEISLGQNSTGGGMNLAGLTMRHDSSINIEKNDLAGHAIIASRDIEMKENAKVEITDNSFAGSAIAVKGDLTLNNASQIIVKRVGDAAEDSLRVNQNLILNNASNIIIDSESTESRNLYVGEHAILNDQTWMKHTSNLAGKAGDVGEIKEWNGNHDTDNEIDKQDVNDDEAERIVTNTELDRYLDDTQAVVFIKGKLELLSGDNFVEITGNADQQKNEVNGTPYGLIMQGSESSVLNGAYIKIDNVRVGLLAKTLTLDYQEGSTEYDSMPTMLTNEQKSRVYAQGTYIGAICTNYFRVLRSSNFYAEGGNIGVLARRTSALNGTSGQRLGTTVISVGLNKGSNGFTVTQDARFLGTMRVIAEGDASGVLLTEKSSGIKVGKGAELIAIGRSETSSGTYSDNQKVSKGNIIVNDSGYYYSFGGLNGIYAVNTNVKASAAAQHQNATIVAIGGVPDKSLSHTFADMDYLNQPFKATDLPMPVLTAGNRDEAILSINEIEVPGIVLDGREDSYGMVVGGVQQPSIKANGFADIIGIGGEYGIANISKVFDDVVTNGQVQGYGGTIRGHGGRVGVWSSAQIYVSTDDLYNSAGLWGYGRDYGVYTQSTMHSYGSNQDYQSYIYGIGIINGLFSEKGYDLDSYAQIIGETWIDPAADSDAPLGNAAVKVFDAQGAMDIEENALLHEIYNTINMKFTTPYQLNVGLDAVGQNIGTDSEDLIKYTWTTPIAETEIRTSWNDWLYLSYDINDDQRLLYSGQSFTDDGKLQYGLIPTNLKEGVTIVANRTGLDATLENASGVVYGDEKTASHRMTFRNAAIIDLRTMQVQIDLREIIGTSNYDINDLPTGLTFELDYTPLLLDGYQEKQRSLTIAIDDLDDVHYNREAGMLTFYKLHLGQYVLRSVNQYGWPYQDLEEIPFAIIVDTRSDANGPGGKDDSWTNSSDWVETIYVGYYQEQEDGSYKWIDLNSALAQSMGNTQLQSPDNKSQPTFPVLTGLAAVGVEETNQELFNRPSYYVGKIEAYYHRIQYDVDVRPVDKDNHQSIGNGRFEYTGYLEGSEGTEVVPMVTIAGSGVDYHAVYPTQKMYAGLIYKIEQTRTQMTNSGYYSSGTAHDFRLMYNSETDVYYVDDVSGGNYNEEYYNFVTFNGDLLYHIWAGNQWQGQVANAELKLVDYDLYADGTIQLLDKGEFELYSKIDGGTDFYRDNSFVANGDGTFTFQTRPGAQYQLHQVETNPGYQIHTGYYSFSYDVSMSIDALAHQVELIDEISGWEGWSGEQYESIIISNTSNAGELVVQIDAKGIWHGHGDAMFVIELKQVGDSRYNKFYSIAAITGATMFSDSYHDEVHHREVIFDEIPRGEYEVTVYDSLRTGNGGKQIKKSVAMRQGIGEPVRFEFSAYSEHLLSGSDMITNCYTVRFD